MLIQPNSRVQSVTTVKLQRQETETACSTSSIVERITRCPPAHIYLSHFTKILLDKCQLIRGSHPNLCYVKNHTPTKLEVLLSHCYVRHTEGPSLSLNKSFLLVHVSSDSMVAFGESCNLSTTLHRQEIYQGLCLPQMAGGRKVQALWVCLYQYLKTNISHGHSWRILGIGLAGVHHPDQYLTKIALNLTQIL